MVFSVHQNQEPSFFSPQPHYLFLFDRPEAPSPIYYVEEDNLQFLTLPP